MYSQTVNTKGKPHKSWILRVHLEEISLPRTIIYQKVLEINTKNYNYQKVTEKINHQGKFIEIIEFKQ